MSLRSRGRFFPGIVALSAGILIAGLLPAADTPSGDKIYERALKSTAWVISPVGETGVATGTGSLLDASRKIVLTNYHVVGNRDEALVIFPVIQKGGVVAERSHYTKMIQSKQGLIAAKVIARDTKRDLALLQLQKDVPLPSGIQALKLARESAKPGQRVHSIGNPGTSGALWVYTPGEVRQVYQKRFRVSDRSGKNAFEIDARVVETSSAVNAGDSGGPVVNERGELVAVTQSHANDAQARLVSYFIDVAEVKELLKNNKMSNLIQGGSAVVERPSPAKEKPEATPLSTPPNEDDNERTAARNLKMAKELAKDGKTQRVKERYEEIAEKFPNTKAGKEAKELLEKLGK